MQTRIVSRRAVELCPTKDLNARHWYADGTCKHAGLDAQNWEDGETLATEQQIANEAPDRRASAEETKLEALRRIVATKSYGTVAHQGQLCTVDLTSAHAIVTLHDALSEPARQKLLSLHPYSMAGIAFKLLK